MVRTPRSGQRDLAVLLREQGSPHQLAQAMRIHRALAQRRLSDLTSGAADRQAAARAFFGGAGRAWLIEQLAQSSPTDRVIAAAGQSLTAEQLAGAQLDRWMAHPDARVKRLAIAGGATPNVRTIGRWIEFSRTDDGALAGLLAASPKLVLRGLADTRVPPRLARAIRGSQEWLLALGRIPQRAAVGVIDEAPLSSLLALLDRPELDAGLFAAVCRRPSQAALPVLLRGTERPSLRSAAEAGLARWLSAVGPQLVTGALRQLGPRQADILQRAVERHPQRVAFLEAQAMAGGRPGREALIQLVRAAPRRARPVIARYFQGTVSDAAAAVAAAFLDHPARHGAGFRQLLRSADPSRQRLGLVSLALAGQQRDLSLMLAKTRPGEASWNRLVWAAVTRLAPRAAPGILARRVSRRRLSGRAEALERLVRTEASVRQSVIEMALSDPDPSMRLVAARLSERPASDLQVARIRLLSRRDPDSQVRAAAYLALGRLAPTRAIRLIAKGLEDAREADSVRRSAATALAQLGDPRAIAVLQRRLDDPRVAGACAEALMQLTAHYLPLPAGGGVERLRAYKKRWHRWLEAHRARSMAARYKAALASGDPRRQALAMRALASGNPRAQLDMLEAWRAAAPKERRQLIRALGLRGPAGELASLGAVLARVRGEQGSRTRVGFLLAGDASGTPLVRLRWDPLRVADQLVAGMARPESDSQRLRRRRQLRLMTGLSLPEDWVWPVWWGAVRDRFDG